MLKEIIIKNFKSFRNEVVFSMEADTKRVSEYADEHVTIINDNSLLKVASMYGPNGGGKSNLIRAITFARNLVINENDLIFPQEMTNIFNAEAPIELTFYFIDEDYEYGYNLVFKTKINPDNAQSGLIITIINESVGFRRNGEQNLVLLYERSETGFVSEYLPQDVALEVPKNITLLHRLNEVCKNNQTEIYRIIDNLYQHFTKIVTLKDNVEETFWCESKLLDLITKSKNQIIRCLNSVDIRISDIRITSKKDCPISFVRVLQDNDTTIAREISLLEESEGTRKIFYYILKIIEGVKERVIFLSDDMNSFLHPKLCALIVRQFTSEENRYSQLIFNSHDIINMNADLFRRDEIWFAYRDENYASVLVPLSNIVDFRGKQVRKDVVYSKQYLEGKFGSDPFIQKGLKWYE